MYVFDLDGTLVDTRLAVKEAYRRAGIEMPDHAWGKAWYEWCPSDVHRRKCIEYADCLRMTRVLPLARVAVNLNAEVITGASPEAVNAIKTYHFLPLNVVLRNATLNDKITYLNLLSSHHKIGTYVDDDATARDRVAKETLWNSISPEECLRSFSLLGPTPA